MKKSPNVYTVADVVEIHNSASTEINPGRWCVARPVGLYSIKQRLKCAWWAFTGKADLVIWPCGQ